MQELTPEGSIGGLLFYLAHPLTLCLVSIALALFVVARRHERMRRAALAAIVSSQPRRTGLGFAPTPRQTGPAQPAAPSPERPEVRQDDLQRAEARRAGLADAPTEGASIAGPQRPPARLRPLAERPPARAPRAAGARSQPALAETHLVRQRRSAFLGSPEDAPGKGPQGGRRDALSTGPGHAGLTQISLRATPRYKVFSCLCALLFPALLYGTTLFEQPAGERGILLPVLGYGLWLLSAWHALWVMLWRLDYDSIGLSTRNRLFQPEARMWRALTGITSDGPFITLFHFADGLVMRVPNFIQGRRHMILTAQSWLHDGHAPDRP